MKAQTIIKRAIAQASGQAKQVSRNVRHNFTLYYQGRPIHSAFTYNEKLALCQISERTGMRLSQRDIIDRQTAGGVVALFIREPKLKLA